ncbi:MAG TPA: peptidylprolyl isomerase [Lentisphaeria bacterium]|nr:peptidylprolyl isomerase [Lentisphaeria bacterium]
MKRKMMRHVCLGTLLAVLPMMSVSALAQEGGAQPAAEPAAVEKYLASLPEVVATYDGGEVKSKMIVQVISAQKEAMQSDNAFTVDVVKGYVHDLAGMMLDQALAVSEAKARGIAPNNDQAAKELEAIKGQHSKEDFTKLLKANGIDSEETLRQRIAERIMVNDMVKKEAAVTPEEVKKFYDENPQFFNFLSASHILVRFEKDDDSRAAAKTKIESIQKQLKEGADFAELAKQHSDCPSKEQGGSLGKFGRGQMVQEFEQALLKLKKDEVSEPVETQFGYHLIKSAGESTQPLAEVQPRITEFLEQQKGQKTYTELIAKLRTEKNAKILVEAPPAPVMPGAPAGNAP